MTVPALLTVLGVNPVAHWVQVVAVEQTAQLLRQGWHWLLLFRNCPEVQVTAQTPLVRVVPEGQEVHWLLAAPEQVAQEVWQDWH